MALFDAVKLYLGITWSDPDTDTNVAGILARAQTKLCAYAGVESLDFADGTDEQQLLFDLCRYVYNNASEDFEDNYRADLIMLRAKYNTEAMTDESETQDGGTGC